MQLIISIDLEKAKLSLAEVFSLLADQGSATEVDDAAVAGAGGPINDLHDQVIGSWQVEETEERPQPQASRYRAAAQARYGRRGQIEVDRFALVSGAEGGAYVQGWLFVPEEEVRAQVSTAMPPAKPPQSVLPMRKKTGYNAG